MGTSESPETFVERNVRYILEQCKCPTDLRGDGIYAVGVKRGPIRQRFPKWLYCGKD